MPAVVPLLLLFLAPVVGGLLFGFVQLTYYRVQRRSAETIPPFPILFARGLVLFFVIAATIALVLRFSP